MFLVNRNPSVSDLHKFGWAMVGGFGVIGLILWLAATLGAPETRAWMWIGSRPQVAAVCLWVLGALLWAVSIFLPAVAKPVYIGWMSATVPIGIVMSTIMLSVLFFVLLPVFSLVVRFGDPLRKRLTPGGSYWEDYKPYEPTLERMKRQF